MAECRRQMPHNPESGPRRGGDKSVGCRCRDESGLSLPKFSDPTDQIIRKTWSRASRPNYFLVILIAKAFFSSVAEWWGGSLEEGG